MRRLIVAGILLPFLAVGCGSKGGSPQSSGTGGAPAATGTQAAPAPTSRGPAFPLAAANAAGRQALLTINDFPAGWSTSKDTSSGPNDKYVAQLSGCLHAPPGLLGRGGSDAANVDSPDFDSSDGNTTVSETVTVASSAKVAQLFSILKQANTPDCLATTLNNYVKQQAAKSSDPAIKQATIGAVQVGQLSSDKYDDDTVALRASVPVSSRGLSLNVYVDLLFVRHTNALAIMSFEGEATPVETSTTSSLTQLAAQKLAGTSFPAA